LKIQVLGCSGAELPDSHLPGFMIDGRILLDAGTIGAALDIKQQGKIRYILITHAHLDHIKGIPFLADNIAADNKNHHITLVSKSQVIQALKHSLLNGIVWPDFAKIPTPANPVVRFKTIPVGKAFTIDGYSITAYRVSHSIPAVGYLVEDKRGRRLLYTGDTGPTETLWSMVNRTKIHGLIIEVSLPNKFAPLALKTGHLTPKLLKTELEKMNSLPDRIFISHYKPHYKERIKREVEKLGIRNITILRDGDTFHL
jgi:ribonuclease BN (tRNA processing enzyme)